MVPPISTKVSPPWHPFPDIFSSPLTPSVPSPHHAAHSSATAGTCASVPLLWAPLLAAPHTLPRSCPSHWAGSRRQRLQFSSPAPRENLSCIVLAHPSALACAPDWVGPKKSKSPVREVAFTPCTGCFGRGGSRQLDNLENPAALASEATPEAGVPTGELPNSWHHVQQGVCETGTAHKPPLLCRSLGPSFQQPAPYTQC